MDDLDDELYYYERDSPRRRPGILYDDEESWSESSASQRSQDSLGSPAVVLASGSVSS